MTGYTEFLARKAPRVHPAGIEPGELHASLYPFQHQIVSWALELGRAAIFADCGQRDYKRGPNRCGVCGGLGHNRRTCPEAGA